MAVAIWREVEAWRTFVAVDVCILDHYGSTIDGRVLLCLALVLPHIPAFFSIGELVGRYPEHMAGKKLFRSCKVGIWCCSLAVSAIEKRLGRGNKQDLAGSSQQVAVVDGM